MPIMHDGLHTIIAFNNSGAAGVLFKETALKPFGFDGRGPINITSLRNNFVVTKVPKQLCDVTAMMGTAEWDSDLYITILNDLLQINQICQLQFPNGNIWQFWGWLDKFDPQEHKEGELPLANLTIEVSNLDDAGFEVLPTKIS